MVTALSEPWGYFAPDRRPTNVAVGKFNVDEKLDLAVADSGSKTVSILLNTTK
jgi:hypothetical protein